MPALPPNSTARLFMDYNTCGHDHTAEARFDAPNTPNDAAAALADLISIIGGSFYHSDLIGLRYVVAGGSVSVPVVPVGFPASWGAAAGPEDASAHFLSFIGRTTGGKRSQVTLFGCTIVSSGNKYRVPAAASEAVQDSVAALNGEEGNFIGIDGLQPLWKQYANIGVNAYWRNKIR